MINRKHSLSGFTLIEVLISMLLAVMFLAGILQVLSINSQSFRIRDSLARVQEDGRLAIELISRELRHTGFLVYPYTDDTLVDGTPLTSIPPGDALAHQLFKAIPDAFSAADDVPQDAAVFGITAAAGDSFIIRYQINHFDDLNSSICGASFATPGNPNFIAINTNLAAVVDSDGDGNRFDEDGVNAVITEKFDVRSNQLYCDARIDYYNDSSLNIKTHEVNALPLISNVENLRVLYGIDTDPHPLPPDDLDPNKAPNQYVDAQYITDNLTLDDWQTVSAIKITLILRTDKTNLNSADTISPMIINGGFGLTISDVTARRLYRVFTTTIMLRNRALWP